MVKPMSRILALPLIITLMLALLPAIGAADSISWAKVDPALQALMTAQPNGQWNVIVEGTTPDSVRSQGRSNADRAKSAADRLALHRGTAKAKLTIIGGAAGGADYAAIAALSRDPFVAYVHYDAPVYRLDLPPSDEPPSSNVYEQVSRASDVWNLGFTGKGVAVAVLDSGVADSPDLTVPVNRIAARVDLVGDGSSSYDPGGHGSHVAGIIAGNGFSAPAGMATSYRGVAPDARIIDVRVLGSQGNGSLSKVIAGVQWVVQNRTTYNIRVMNLSLGAPVPATYTYQKDPLVAALDVAWLSGITVVTAAGNTGPGAGTIESPGAAPMPITVGALDDAATTSNSDDTIPSWSSQGPTADGISKPDLVAAGRRIVSLYTAGSYLESILPERVVPTAAGTYFRLSGTSMAAPVVAGTVALLLEKNPGLKPDQIKNILSKTSRSMGSYDQMVVGAGAVDAYAAINSSLVEKANKGKRPADGFARTILPLIKGQPLSWRDLSYAGRNWTNITWDNITWDNITWDNIVWDNIVWDSILWDNITWDNITWDATWSSIGQDSVAAQSYLLD